MKSEDWELAIAKCDEALKLDPRRSWRATSGRRPRRRSKNRAAYNSFLSPRPRRTIYDSAVAATARSPRTRSTGRRAPSSYAQVKKAFCAQHLEAAKAKGANKCEEARQHVEAVLTVDESQQRGAGRSSKSCGTPVKPPPWSSERRRPSPEPSEERRAPKANEPTSIRSRGAGPTRRHEPAERPRARPDTPHRGRIRRRRRSCRRRRTPTCTASTPTRSSWRARRSKAQPGKAWRIIGASSCFLKDRGGAISGLASSTRRAQFLKYVCSRNAITVP